MHSCQFGFFYDVAIIYCRYFACKPSVFMDKDWMTLLIDNFDDFVTISLNQILSLIFIKLLKLVNSKATQFIFIGHYRKYVWLSSLNN